MAEYYQFARSAQGYNHIKTNKVCQDASGARKFEDVSIIAVADGHGSDDYIRTDRGSAFAVSAALSAIEAFVRKARENNLPAIPDSEADLVQVAKNILAQWHEQVENDVALHPFRIEEMEKVSEKYKHRYASGRYNAKAYGTTLIAVCMTNAGWFGVHIGDGKCVEMCMDGSICEPIPWDDACEQNITTSICDSDAIDEFRYVVQKDTPAAIFIGSDGVDDSYPSELELYELYRSIFTIFVEHGNEVGSSEIRDYLPKITRRGSGDDVSIACLIHSELSDDIVARIKLCGEEVRLRAKIQKAEHDHRAAMEKKAYIESNLERNRAEYQTLEKRLSDAEAVIRASEDVLYKAQDDWKMLRSRMDALDRDVEGDTAMLTVDGRTSVPSAGDSTKIQLVEEAGVPFEKSR